MLAKIIRFVKDYQEEIVLFIAVFLISLLSFAAGYIISERTNEEKINFENVQEE